MERQSDTKTLFSVTLAANSAMCNGFLSFPYTGQDAADKYDELYAIIAPVRILPNEDKTTSVNYACNLGSHCHNPDCVYALPAKQARRG